MGCRFLFFNPIKKTKKLDKTIIYWYLEIYLQREKKLRTKH
jgi:hypothetical protein